MTLQKMCLQKSLGVLAVLTVLSSCVLAGPRCNDIDLAGCMDALKVLTNNQDLAFAQTERELSQTCGHLQEAMQCVNSFTSRCFDEKQRELYRTMTSGAQQLLADLCTQGSGFREKYLLHASCYRNLSSEYRKCANNYLTQQEKAKHEYMPDSDKLRKSCCLFDGYKECTRVAVLHKCSPEAADLGEQIVMKAGGPLVQTHCANYKHNTPECMLYLSTGFSPVQLSHVSIIFFLLIHFLSMNYLLAFR